MRRDEAENITQKTVAILEKERIRRQITKMQISKATGLSRTALTLIVDKKNSPTLRTLLMLASAIGVDLKKIIAQAEKTDESLSNKDVE